MRNDRVIKILKSRVATQISRLRDTWVKVDRILFISEFEKIHNYVSFRKSFVYYELRLQINKLDSYDLFHFIVFYFVSLTHFKPSRGYPTGVTPESVNNFHQHML